MNAMTGVCGLKATLCLACGDLRLGSTSPCLGCGRLDSGNPALDLLFTERFYSLASLRALGAILARLRVRAASSAEATTAFLWFFATAFPGEFEMRTASPVRDRLVRLLAEVTFPPFQLDRSDGTSRPMGVAALAAALAESGVRPNGASSRIEGQVQSPASPERDATRDPRQGRPAEEAEPCRCGARPAPTAASPSKAARSRLQLTWRRAFEAFPEFHGVPPSAAQSFDAAAYARKARALAAVLDALRAVPGSDERHRDRERATALLKVLIEGMRRSTCTSRRWLLRLEQALRALVDPVLYRRDTGRGALGASAAIVAALAERLEAARGSGSRRAA